MDRKIAWGKIRDSIPGTFYQTMKAKNIEKEVRLSRPVLQAQTHFTPFNELVQNHREKSYLDELIEQEREFTKIKQKEFSKRWDLSYERLQGLHQALDKFSKYHENCQSKIEKDKKYFQKTREEIEDQNQEIRKLTKELNMLKRVKRDFERRRNLCESSKEYLNKVVLSSGNEYENIQELIARFGDLKSIRDETTQKTLHQIETSVKTLEIENVDAKKGQNEELAYLIHNSNLGSYKDRLISHNGKMNEKVIRVKESNHLRILSVEQSKMSINTLYLNLCQEMNQPVKLSEKDVKEQLEFIKQFLGELTKVTHKVREFFKCGSDIVAIPDVYLHKFKNPKINDATLPAKDQTIHKSNIPRNVRLDSISHLPMTKKVRRISNKSDSYPYRF